MHGLSKKNILATLVCQLSTHPQAYVGKCLEDLTVVDLDFRDPILDQDLCHLAPVQLARLADGRHRRQQLHQLPNEHRPPHGRSD